MSGPTSPPPHPWEKRKGYACVDLRVRLVETPEGWVFSEHDFATPEDEKTVLAQGGHKQIAYALTTEALRRETFVCLLVAMSREPRVLEWYAKGDESYRQSIENQVSNAALATLMGLAQKMLPGISKEVIHMALSQKGDSNSSPDE